MIMTRLSLDPHFLVQTRIGSEPGLGWPAKQPVLVVVVVVVVLAKILESDSR